MKKILIILLFFVALKSSAQQDPHYTQYMYNTLSVNPAYAGSRGVLTGGLLGRTQWVGIEGAPKTQTFFIHSPVFHDKVGLGLALVNDKIGAINQTFATGNFAYHLKLNAKNKLAFGISGGINLFQPKLASLQTINANDPSFVNTNAQNTIVPNVGAGLYYYSEHFYVGMSSPNMLQNKVKMGSNIAGQSAVLQKRHYFMIIGSIFKINELLKLKPTAMLKMVENSPASMDITLEALMYEKFSIGFAHRWKESVSALVGYNINPQFKIGFACDYTVTSLRTYNSGTFEIMLQYDAMFKRDKVKSPRYF